MDQLVKRLMLNTPVITQEHMDAATEIMPKAAARIKALTAERDALRAAIIGYIEALDHCDDEFPSLDVLRGSEKQLRAALAQQEGAKE